MPDPDFVAQLTVARYIKSIHDLSPTDRDARLQILADFATFVDRQPDQMIVEVFNEETRKYRKRGYYTEKAKEFAATRETSPNAQLRVSNIIRGFFIANGRRLLPEKPSWMTT